VPRCGRDGVGAPRCIGAVVVLAATLLRELGDNAGTAGTLLHYGRVLTRTATTPAQVDEGVQMLRESLQLYEQADQFWGAGWALQYLGQTAFEQGDLDAAQATLEQAYASWKQVVATICAHI
jgi:tetratricopeptide (TPR) repeat protein